MVCFWIQNIELQTSNVKQNPKMQPKDYLVCKYMNFKALWWRKSNTGDKIEQIIHYSLAWLSSPLDLKVNFSFDSWRLRVSHFEKFEYERITCRFESGMQGKLYTCHGCELVYLTFQIRLDISGSRDGHILSQLFANVCRAKYLYEFIEYQAFLPRAISFPFWLCGHLMLLLFFSCIPK
jgi:hypothetical protein